MSRTFGAGTLFLTSVLLLTNGLLLSAQEPPEDLAAKAGRLVEEARGSGDAHRGAEVFADARFGCVTCHKVGKQGGDVGPDLSAVGLCVPPQEIAEAVLWPRRKVKEGYAASVVATADGKVLQGFLDRETTVEIVLRDPTSGERHTIAKTGIEERRDGVTLMPDGLAESMTPVQRRDLIRFLLDLGRDPKLTGLVVVHDLTPAKFPLDPKPLDLARWPNWRHRVNRDRIYDFYAKEAEYFLKQEPMPRILPEFPGMDGGVLGHWGNQSDVDWVDDRWSKADLGRVLSGVFRSGSLTVAKAICVRLGERGEMSVCFDPETLCYEALRSGGFVNVTPVRHGFIEGLRPDGTPLPRPEGRKPEKPFQYLGFYRHGDRFLFSYRIDGVDYLDAPWVENGEFTRVVAPAAEHPLRAWTRGGGQARWPEVLTTRGQLGTARPYAVDTIEVPFTNPWGALMFFGDHDFLPDGSALLCTMTGDVWHVSGLDADLKAVRWRRFATGLHQALGLVVADGKAHVLGRDQITRLHDLDNDGEADFYECVTNRYLTSPSGHDYICGLQRDPAGNFYTASGAQGVLRLSPDGKTSEILATGFRNPDGLALGPDGTITLPCSEGEWTSSSMICQIRPGGHYGYGGPKGNQPPDLPLVYLPRGLDNSSGAQVFVTSDRWGPLRGQMIHLSFGMGAHFLVLREEVNGQFQGATVPLAGEFRSGVHRGRFSPADGQLYVSGMAGWGSYTPDDGCFQRVRYTGDPVQLPVGFHVRENGVLIEFARPIDRSVAETARHQFAQAWNYRYGSQYGSPEFSPSHPTLPGHDVWSVRSAHVLDDGRTLFLEIPEIQTVNQLHLHVKADSGPAHDLFLTVHKLGAPFADFSGYKPEPKTIAAHPILADLARAKSTVPNPFRRKIAGARDLTIEAGKNLGFSTRTLTVRAGEPIRLTFRNPDVVPHNWALARPGSLERVGALVNKIISDPEAAARQYVPRTDDVLVHTDIVDPGAQFEVFFRAPQQPGRYPYLCTFPGHWMVMNGVLVVE